MKWSKLLPTIFLLGLILIIPHNVKAEEAKKCLYDNGSTITIHTDNTAEVSDGIISWNWWKKKNGNQLICPKYIIMSNPVAVRDSLEEAQKYSTQNKANYYKLVSSEIVTKSDNNDTQNNSGKTSESYLGKVDDDDSVAWLIKKVLNYVRIAGPVLVLILTSVDYLRALIQSDDETMAKINKKLGTRLLLVVLLFLIPTLVNVVLSLVGYDTSNTEAFK